MTMENKWIILYENKNKAVEYIKNTLSEYVDYDVEIYNKNKAEQYELNNCNIISVGTDKALDGYKIEVTKSPYNTDKQTISIKGKNDIFTLYGAIDFKNKYIPMCENADMHNPIYYFNKPFYDKMKETVIESNPSKNYRALWSWGYVIYNYKKYIDNMVELKLNMLIVWNDYPPENAKEFIEYAHENGIKIIWGFAWGWDTNCLDIDVSDLNKLSDSIIEKYEKEYAHLNPDGIYFQSFTETDKEYTGGKLIAEAVTELVNKTSDRLLKKYPDLLIQFGLHHTSVKNRLQFIKKVDPRVYILWEDCGAFPYHYIPKKIENFDETKDITKKLLFLRENEKFGAVLKGHTCLDWSTFTHQSGNFKIGEKDEEFLKNKFKEKEKILRYIQSWWIVNADKACEMIRLMDENSIVAALVEDGAFEECIPYSVALFAEMLWDSSSDIKDIMSRVALSSNVKFV